MTDRQIAQLIDTGLGFHRSGNLQQAETTYRQVLEQRPNHPDAQHLLGVIAHQVGQHEVGAQMIQQALRVAPKLHAAWNNLGEALRASGKVPDAIAAYQQAITLQPSFADAIGNLARGFEADGKTKEAIDTWQRFIRLQPKNIEAYHSLATALHSDRQEGPAIACWQKLLSLDPTFHKASNDIGVVLGGRGLFDEAEKHFHDSIRHSPNYAVAYYNLGVIYERQARYDEAIARYRESAAIDPNAPDPQLNLALMLLLKGDLPGGLQQYEWRWKLPRVLPLIKPFKQPEWRGESVEGKTLIIHAEQGMGDTLQFARYGKAVAARGAKKIYFMVQKPLLSLLQQLTEMEVIPDDAIPEVQFDLHLPSLSLPKVLGTTVETIPAEVPYLKADDAIAATWRDRLAADPNFKVGITWAGRPEHHNDHNRSAALDQFAPLAAVPGVTFYSLQKGPAAVQSRRPPAGMNLVDCDPALTDFAASAGLVANLDLLISVDTSVVHLAGAMGKPTWTLLPMVPDWRWMIDRPDTPWYPTMRLFRQKQLKNWPEVFRDMAGELAKVVAEKSKPAAATS